MEEKRDRIVVYFNNGETLEYEGRFFFYREDVIKEGCIHFKDSEGNHHRIYNAVVTVDEI